MRKFNGKQWRRLCEVDDCLKEAQKYELCHKHHLISPTPMPKRQNTVKRSLFTESSKSASMDFEYKRRRIHSQSTVLARNHHGIDMYASSNGLLRKQSIGEGSTRPSWEEFIESKRLAGLASLGSSKSSTAPTHSVNTNSSNSNNLMDKEISVTQVSPVIMCLFSAFIILTSKCYLLDKCVSPGLAATCICFLILSIGRALLFFICLLGKLTVY